jgi:hypothetical protein
MGKVMRVLLLHPNDSPLIGLWSRERWDLVVDLGFASPHLYEEWSRILGTRVRGIYQLDGHMEGYRWVEKIVEHGRGRLLDRMGLDWWEILAVWSYQELRALYLLDKLLELEIPAGQIELAASRSHLFAKIVGRALDQPVRCFQHDNGPVRRVLRVLRSAQKLRPAQIVEIAFDKWDPGYRVRRHFKEMSRVNLKDPVVLLPSTYSNVTRAELAYARQLPHRRFLLATTRRSAMPDHLPDNVTATSLAGYAAPSTATREETADLRQSWDVFQRTVLQEMKEVRNASSAGLWDYFPHHLENGLRLREAWRLLLDREPVTGVLCGDDLNYYTRLPLILARRSGLNTMYCSHGALDGGFLFKMPVADSYLVKGEMESDYLQSARSIEPERVFLGAPGTNAFGDQGDRSGGALVFFSQPYEVEGGRGDSIYREILPRLWSAAHQSGRKVIVKLHPFESKRARTALVTSILPRDVIGQVEIVAGTSAEEVMSRAWCGVTVDSSVAVEGALKGIPFFLCGWLDFGGMGYLQQFARFGVGRVLDTPEKIVRIPEMVADYRFDASAMARLWREADPAQLDEIMFTTRRAHVADPCAH